MSETLYKLSVPVSQEAEDSTTELLEGMFGQPACVETDLEANTTHVSVYLRQEPSREKLRNLLPPFALRRLRPENWAESWKRHFKPIEIRSRLLIKPSWSRRKAKPGQRVVVLDPGLSFGTGQHPTTRFCLEQLVAVRVSQRKQSFLDVGTGSGILAISATKLRYAPVSAFDFDPVAVRIARSNARRNRVNLRVARKDVTQEKGGAQYDLICANLLADLLLAERDRLVSWLKPGGTLVLAGVLRLQFRDIQDAYQKAGLNMIASAAENEWESGAFRAVEDFSKK